ncbi:AlpA family phage regulatory protein [Priestia flexa]|nr:AlpA family phage regulatory protein [Ferrimonas balearica]
MGRFILSQLLTLKDVVSKVRFCRSKVYLLISKGEFPKPRKEGGSSRWLESEIDLWIEQLPTD